MPAADAVLIKWWLKHLSNNAADLTESELKLVISFEEQFERNGSLSERQMEVLEQIYRRH